ncbi:hypothetical protein OAI27_09765 [Planktomarina temperata]|nr:hypothetical protein [Planktomarina temperata]
MDTDQATSLEALVRALLPPLQLQPPPQGLVQKQQDFTLSPMQ